VLVNGRECLDTLIQNETSTKFMWCNPREHTIKMRQECVLNILSGNLLNSQQNLLNSLQIKTDDTHNLCPLATILPKLTNEEGENVYMRHKLLQTYKCLHITQWCN
jgi:hypothetical protein